jgi:phosphoribosylanthranilate isomerase
MTKVKICGITNLDDGVYAAEAGADLLGYMFWPRSKRYVRAAEVSRVVAQLREMFPGLRHVGVFVDQPLDEVDAAVRECGLDLAQLHGSESAGYYAEAAQRQIPVVRVLRLGPGAPEVNWREGAAEFFLCDRYDAAAVGGTGVGFDPKFMPKGLPMERTFIAGGLTSETVVETVQRLRPYGVDVSSGVEAAPGRKDHGKVRAFVEAVRLVKGR